jgi:hypothetical protein
MSRQPTHSARHRRPPAHYLRNRVLTVGVATAVISTGLLATAPKARALDTHCHQEANGQIICTFNLTPDSDPAQTFPIVFDPPPGFAVADATLQGGHGGNGGGTGGAGGAGGSTHGTLTIPGAGELPLDIYIGDEGSSGNCDDPENSDGGSSDGDGGNIHGGDGAGTQAGPGNCSGGGGGGGTFIMRKAQDPTQDTALAAAGGGGGGAGNDGQAGGDGGGGNGSAGHGTAGGGGGKTTPQQDGAGGTGAVPPNGGSGSPGNGGGGGEGVTPIPVGCSVQCGGGGGGGGFHGGGGGAAGGGGGGGSGCLPCPPVDLGGFQTTSIPGGSAGNTAGPVFHEAQAGSVLLIFGNIIAPSGTPNQPGGPGGPGGQPRPGGHGGHNNDPNPNNDPNVPAANDVANTVTAACNPRIGVCTVRPPAGPDSLFAVTARGGSSKALLFGTLMGGSRPDCPNYSEINADWVAFGFRNQLAGSSWHKTAKLTTRHKLSHDGAALLSKKMQICFEAPYRFLTRDGYQLGGHNGVFDGVLPDCSALAGGAQRGMARPCVATRQILARHGGWVVRFIFQVPANSKDPKALG